MTYYCLRNSKMSQFDNENAHTNTTHYLTAVSIPITYMNNKMFIFFYLRVKRF